MTNIRDCQLEELVLKLKNISMKFRTISLINSMFILLLAVGMNHCVFESLFNSSSNELAASQAVESHSGDCQSHPKGDPASHPEGQKCNYGAVNVSFQTQVAPTEIYSDLRSWIFASLVLPQSYKIQSFDFNLANVTETVSDLLVSLSISSNAPPALA